MGVVTDVGDADEGEDWDRAQKSCGSNWKQSEEVISWPVALNIARSG